MTCKAPTVWCRLTTNNHKGSVEGNQAKIKSSEAEMDDRACIVISFSGGNDGRRSKRASELSLFLPESKNVFMLLSMRVCSIFDIDGNRINVDTLKR